VWLFFFPFSSFQARSETLPSSFLASFYNFIILLFFIFKFYLKKGLSLRTSRREGPLFLPPTQWRRLISWEMILPSWLWENLGILSFSSKKKQRKEQTKKRKQKEKQERKEE
jgi:hypothetical protein